eukprot:73987_1
MDFGEDININNIVHDVIQLVFKFLQETDGWVTDSEDVTLSSNNTVATITGYTECDPFNDNDIKLLTNFIVHPSDTDYNKFEWKITYTNETDTSKRNPVEIGVKYEDSDENGIL